MADILAAPDFTALDAAIATKSDFIARGSKIMTMNGYPFEVHTAILDSSGASTDTEFVTNKLIRVVDGFDYNCTDEQWENLQVRPKVGTAGTAVVVGDLEADKVYNVFIVGVEVAR